MRRLFICAVLLFVSCTLPDAARAQAAAETVALDATDVARGILHARLVIPVTPGPRTLVYPRWIPGDHAPVGPINELVALRVVAGGQPLAWQRDLTDMYAFHVTVPAGVRALDVALDYLIGAAGTIASAERVSTGHLAIVNWYAALLYPQGVVNRDYRVAPNRVAHANARRPGDQL
jgi:hypothetical protein